MDENLDEISQLARRLKGLASAAGEEIDQQNSRLTNISGKVDTLDTKIYTNTARVSVFVSASCRTSLIILTTPTAQADRQVGAISYPSYTQIASHLIPYRFPHIIHIIASR